MSYPIPTSDQIRDWILADWRNLDSQVDVTPDSDDYIRATGIGSAILGLYQYATWGINQSFPDTADIDSLVRFGAVRGITQKPASNALGTIAMTGAVNAPIPIGTLAQVGNNQYQTTVVAAIGADGTAAVTGSALTAGVTGNQPDNTPATLQSAPPGIDSPAVLLQMRGGVEMETPASFLARILDRLRHPPAGGNKYDYPRWALEVAGVTAAYGYPLRRGIGTMDVAILSNGLPPPDALRAVVASYIDDRKPAETDSMILAPVQILVAVTGTLILAPGAVLATVLAQIQIALAAYFATLKPGDTVYRNRLITIISDVSGVTDVILATPVVNVTTLVDATHIEIPALGNIALGV